MTAKTHAYIVKELNLKSEGEKSTEFVYRINQTILKHFGLKTYKEKKVM